MSAARLHIHAPAGRYIGQRRKRGARRWETVTAELISKERALSWLVKRLGGYPNGRVIFVADWYDPIVVAEIKQ